MFCIIWDNVIIALETFKYVTFLSDIWFIGRFGELHFACVFVCVCVCVCVCVRVCAVYKAGHEGHKEEVLVVSRKEHMVRFMS